MSDTFRTIRRPDDYRRQRRQRTHRPASPPQGWTGAAATTTKRSDGKMVGTIKRLVREKGFGFVRGEDGQERFFHRSALAPGMDFDSLREGEVVSFDIEDSQKGPRACRIDRA